MIAGDTCGGNNVCIVIRAQTPRSPKPKFQRCRLVADDHDFFGKPTVLASAPHLGQSFPDRGIARHIDAIRRQNRAIGVGRGKPFVAVQIPVRRQNSAELCKCGQILVDAHGCSLQGTGTNATTLCAQTIARLSCSGRGDCAATVVSIARSHTCPSGATGRTTSPCQEPR